MSGVELCGRVEGSQSSMWEPTLASRHIYSSTCLRQNDKWQNDIGGVQSRQSEHLTKAKQYGKQRVDEQW